MQIVVIGMHRSGTSMVCRLVNMMGAYFGPEGCQWEPNTENPRGFWERKDFRALNDDILGAANCSWHEIDPWFEGGPAEAAAASFRERAGRLIFQLEAFRPWVTKEPRFCLTFPFYRPHLEFPVVILVARKPGEVAVSLNTRDGFAREKSLQLWRQYNAEALRITAACPRLVVNHSDLMARPVEEVSRLFTALDKLGVRGLRLPSDKEILNYIDPKLHRSTDPDDMGSTAESQLFQDLLNAHQLTPDKA